MTSPPLSPPSRKPGLFSRPKRGPAPKISETAEHKTIADFLAIALGGNAVPLHIRNERAGVGARIEASRMGILPGCPDWLIVDGGRAYFIELKPRGWRDRKAVPSRHELRQAKTRERLQRAGAPAVVCETLDDVIVALQGWGVPLRVSGSAA